MNCAFKTNATMSWDEANAWMEGAGARYEIISQSVCRDNHSHVRVTLPDGMSEDGNTLLDAVARLRPRVRTIRANK